MKLKQFVIGEAAGTVSCLRYSSGCSELHRFVFTRRCTHRLDGMDLSACGMHEPVNSRIQISKRVFGALYRTRQKRTQWTCWETRIV